MQYPHICRLSVMEIGATQWDHVTQKKTNLLFSGSLFIRIYKQVLNHAGTGIMNCKQRQKYRIQPFKIN